MDWKFLFFSLKGRISRKGWWGGMLSVVALQYALSIPLLWMLGADPDYYWNDSPATAKTALTEAIIFVITLRLFFAVDIKRIHDRGRTAYLLVPLYFGWLLVTLQQGRGHDPLEALFNQGQSDLAAPSAPIMSLGLIALLLLYSIWLSIDLGFLRGIKGQSKYGPDPLEPPQAHQS